MILCFTSPWGQINEIRIRQLKKVSEGSANLLATATLHDVSRQLRWCPGLRAIYDGLWQAAETTKDIPYYEALCAKQQVPPASMEAHLVRQHLLRALQSQRNGELALIVLTM